MRLQLLTALCLLNLYAEGSRHQRHEEFLHDDNDNHYNRNWKKKINHRSIPVGFSSFDSVNSDPPDHTKLIPMARYVMHISDWASVATISALNDITGFPFNNVKSIVDGPEANSTGIPYFYMSPLDFTARDLKENPRVTILLSLEESEYCKKMNYDPEDPRCTRLMLSGVIKKVPEGTPEYSFAKYAMFERHPEMADFPPDHEWFIAKLKIVKITMVDWFGGAKFIDVKDYLNYIYPGTEILEEQLKPRSENDIDFSHEYKVSVV